MRDLQRSGPLGDVHDIGQRHLSARRRQRRRQVEFRERIQRLLHPWRDFENHAVLVRLRVDGRDDALPERVVEKIVDGRGRDAETARGRPVDGQVDRLALVREIAGDVGQLGALAQLLDEARRPVGQRLLARVLDDEVILRAGHRGVDREILDRLHVEADARDHGDGLADVADDRRDVALALVDRLQCDEDAAAVLRRVVGIDADERLDVLDILLLQDHVGERLLLRRHSRERDALRGLGHALDAAGVLCRKEPFRDIDVEEDGECERRQRHQQRHGLVIEHEAKQPRVKRYNAVDDGFRAFVEPSPLVFGPVTQQLGAQHRHQRERDDGRDHDRHGERDGKLVKQPTDHVAHEQQRDQHGDQRHGQRDDREADLLRSFERRRERVFALFDETRDVLDHHDGVVDHEARRDRERHQRQIVEAEAEQVHGHQRADEGERDR